MIALGIDIGGTTVKAAGVQDDKVAWTGKSARYARPGREQLVGAIRQACAQLAGPIGAAGLCVPGILDHAKEHVIRATNVPGLERVPLRQLLERAGNVSDFRPIIVNDANATAYDIWSTRKPAGRLLVVAIGTGVGGAVLDDGRPLFVDGDSPGHIGQLDISLEGEPLIAPDGGLGGVEAYLGAAALRARYGPDPASKLKPGDPAFGALVRVLRICHALYRPHHICLAGGVGIRLSRLLREVRQAVADDLTNIARPDWTLSTGESDFHAALGAARIAQSESWPK